jgi:acyl-CoA synthetase (AMP-forming)/AMP-acid ligase II
LLALCASELDSIYLPKDIVFLDELKLTQVGKVDYRQISSDLEELLLGHSYKKDK